MVNNKRNTQITSKLARDYSIHLQHNGLISIIGGKWTIYRLMGEKTIDLIENNKLIAKSNQCSITATLHLDDYTTESIDSHLKVYGKYYKDITKLNSKYPSASKITLLYRRRDISSQV